MATADRMEEGDVTDQLALELEPLTVPEPAPTREEHWRAFAAANPHIEAILVASARDVLAMGHRRVSMRMLWEQVRFRYATTVQGDSTAALNNNHAPYYSRALMEKYDDLAGVFETRDR